MHAHALHASPSGRGGCSRCSGSPRRIGSGPAALLCLAEPPAVSVLFAARVARQGSVPSNSPLSGGVAERHQKVV